MKITTYKYINAIPYSKLNNWSVNYHLEQDHEYNDAYDLANIGSVITRNRQKVVLENEEVYTQVTIRLWGKGVEVRTKKHGKEIGTKIQYRVSEGQFIMSKIDARNGAFGIVPEELEGAITTQDFLSYNINTDKALPKFLKILTSTEQFLKICQSASTGTTGRRRIDEKFFLSIPIPLPTSEEQEEIVHGYCEKVNGAKHLMSKAEDIAKKNHSDLLSRLGIEKLYSAKEKKGLHFVPFSQLRDWGTDKRLALKYYESSIFDIYSIDTKPSMAKSVFRGKSPKYDKNGQSIILNQKCIRWNWINQEYVKKVSDKWYHSLDKGMLTKEGDILINSTGEGTIGRATLITKENIGLLYDSHILCLRLNHSVIDPEYFVNLFNSEYGQKQVNQIKSAKSTKQTELGVKNLKKIVIPLPNLATQKKITHVYSNKMKKIKQLRNRAKEYLESALVEFESQIFKSR